tara:strand:+ start:440 stop:715 length:276 start_codon:yes stop_codon:yes gene_type:complete
MDYLEAKQIKTDTMPTLSMKKTTTKTTTKEMEKYAFTIEEVCELINVCEKTARELVRHGDIQHFTIGTSIRIPWIPLKEWMDNGGTKRRMK